MRNLFLFILFFFTLNCSINKVSNLHGFRFVDTKLDKIELNKSNKNDVRKIIGPPSSKSTFNNSWLYFERKKTNQSLFKLGKKTISRNNILIIEFNKMGLVKDKTLLNLNDMNDIKIAEKKTEKDFTQDNFIYNLLSTLRNKINAPTRRRNNGGP
ncbi:outer membrane protein assembly factor BamE [Candidatus Pelagibacter sp.]|nr:outer membrane protein assembly factor BamE [Candidatus Pelagibacter sp.]